MREMNSTGIVWCPSIPSDWELRRVKDCFYISKVKAGTNNPVVLKLARSGVRVKDVTVNGGQMAESYDDYNPVQVGDLLLNPMDLYSGANCNVSEVEGVISPAYVNLRAKETLNPYYFDYYFKIQYWTMAMFAHGKGVSYDNRWTINAESVKAYELPFPSVSEQNAIVDIIKRKCTQIDALISNAQQQIEKLKAYKQSVITETVTKGLDPDVKMKDSGVEWIGEIPEDWEIVRIKNICQFNPSSKKSFSDDDIVSYAPMECVRTGSLVHKEIAIKNVSSGLTYFEENDIIMAKVTPCFENGNIAIATGLTKGVAFGSSELFVFRANESIKFFLFYFLQNNIFKKFSISTMTGTGGLKRVSPNFVNNYSFALPPIEERNKIVFYLDHKCSRIDKLIALKQQKVEKLQQYKKSLIYEYVTGKKEV